MPRVLVEAVLAIEDRRFFQHPGFDPFRIVGAALRNMKPGGNLQGGSTLIQQFVKNFFLTPDQTLKRKIQEAALSFVLERRASKKELFELYMNEIYLGQVGSFNINGMGEAARVFFQNHDDMGIFVQKGFVDAARAQRIPGSGIDYRYYSPLPARKPDDRFVFLFISRLVKDHRLSKER